VKRDEKLAKELVSWFGEHERSFPWRKTRDPYEIFIAELLLQKTQATMVEKTYNHFLHNFPNIRVLSTAKVSEVRKIVGRLGLSYRAARLVKIAKLIETEHEGRFPRKLDDLLKLPGVGPYVANAVLCFAFNKPALIVDSNVMRVMSRYSGIYFEKDFRERFEKVLKIVPSRKFNLALIDFAALICTPRGPKCVECPIENLCEKCAINRKNWKFLRKVKGGKLREQ